MTLSLSARVFIVWRRVSIEATRLLGGRIVDRESLCLASIHRPYAIQKNHFRPVWLLNIQKSAFLSSSTLHTMNYAICLSFFVYLIYSCDFILKKRVYVSDSDTLLEVLLLSFAHYYADDAWIICVHDLHLLDTHDIMNVFDNFLFHSLDVQLISHNRSHHHRSRTPHTEQISRAHHRYNIIICKICEIT